MTRSVRPLLRTILVAFASLSVLLAGGTGRPASAKPAAAKTTLSITSAAVGSKIAVTGKLLGGAESRSSLPIGTDDTGDDDVVVPDGTDLTGASIKADPVAKKVTFSYTVDDAAPVGGTMTPGWVTLWSFTVNGKDTGQHLQIGNLGGTPPHSGPYFYYCTTPDENTFDCAHEIEGTMDGDTVTATAPFDLLGVSAGSVIGTSQKAGSDTVSVLFGMGNVTNGILINDDMHGADYTVPGGVSLGIAKAGTNPTKVPMTVTAKVTKGAFSGSLARPKSGGSYVVVARTCYGAKTCVYASRIIKI
ncbi:MAG: hypothetical protein LC722_07680 [Actinobacteria bacterium]|nr:hypothetical protein [Actinomycetota bacterium]